MVFLVASLLLVVMPFVTSSFLLLLVTHLLLEAMHLLLVANIATNVFLGNSVSPVRCNTGQKGRRDWRSQVNQIGDGRTLLGGGHRY